MRPVTVSVGPLAAASATAIRTASSAAIGALVLNGALVSAGSTVANGVIVPTGVAVLDSPRQVRFTTSTSEAGKTVLVTGTDRAGNAQSETVTLPSSATTVDTVLSYSTFSGSISAASAGTIAIGTNGLAESQWVRLDEWALQRAGLQVVASGTVNYTVRTTFDDPNSPTNPVAPASVTWFDSTDAAVVAATASKTSVLDPVPTFVKLVLNSGTGSAAMTVVQQGVAPY